MFGSVVMDVPDEVFEAVIEAQCKVAGVKTDAEMNAEDWKVVNKQFKQIYKTYTHEDFPEDPYLQLKLGTEAMFKSWNSKCGDGS